jgi:putative ABC transport system permease protein
MGVAPAVFGLMVGIIAAALLSRFLTSIVFGVGTTDVPTYTFVEFAVLGAAVLASWFPARRAARVDPLIALRKP